MRPDAFEAARSAVYGVENVFNDMPDHEPVTLEEAVQWAYNEYLEIIRTCAGYTAATQFAGKKAVMEAIRATIPQTEIKIKE